MLVDGLTAFCDIFSKFLKFLLQALQSFVLLIILQLNKQLQLGSLEYSYFIIPGVVK